MKHVGRLLLIAALSVAATPPARSGPLGVYGIIERVVFEPNEQAPERIQLHGAFMYVDIAAGAGLTVSSAARGYMYFRLPVLKTDEASVRLVRTEWTDLKSVAGTGQAVGFGHWGYIGRFDGLAPTATNTAPPYILEPARRGGTMTDLRVHAATERNARAASYETNMGVVKLPENGSHAAIVKQLKDALKR
jgi:hypothetical protein